MASYLTLAEEEVMHGLRKSHEVKETSLWRAASTYPMRRAYHFC